ncbi:hypothetical protein AAFF_G00262480 [Aldrovandia affinis]|uniref:Uncharacterized protein n=1 Tax=Aldrovandia affinis TaxID=143900 RepID=A0AAD7SSJ4_9TELE|nr:hypothetical protein AAFF_G00262480 [Aldrovandia affinis]
MSSKIPVHQDIRHAETAKSKATARHADNMKRAKFEFKETTVPSQFTFATKTEHAGIFNTPFPRKKLPAKVHKGPSTRVDAEIRDQYKYLEACNVDLKKDLSQSKDMVDQLQQQYTDLQGENNEIQKQLENCLHLLVAGNIDLASGEKIAETTQQKEVQRKDVRNVSQELMGELQKFGQKASEHRLQVQQLQERMGDLREKRRQHLEEREAFSLEMEEMEGALGNAEQLLLEEM